MIDLYQELENQVLPTLEAYQTDLTTHDRQFIKDNPGLPFLHYSRAYGTTIIPFITADKYPAKYEQVPYLFGHADREHILSDAKVGQAIYHAKPQNGSFTCRYFNGTKLKIISCEQGVKIAKEYARQIRAEWKFNDSNI